MLMFCVAGCGSAVYRTPGQSANMALFSSDADSQTDPSIAVHMRKQPLAPLPAHLAVARIQGPGYPGGKGRGAYSVLTVHTVQVEEDLRRLERLAEVAAVVPLSRLVLPDRFQTEQDLRESAGRLRADMLLVYTLETESIVDDDDEPVSWFTLGISPHVKTRIATTGSAILLDVRSGYVYAVTEATDRQSHKVNHWTSKDTIEVAQRDLEVKIIGELVDNFERLWPGLIEQHKYFLSRS
jgi:hypothetical protein